MSYTGTPSTDSFGTLALAVDLSREVHQYWRLLTEGDG
jgi:hypothetical protein